jgi:hypothetical protein
MRKFSRLFVSVFGVMLLLTAVGAHFAVAAPAAPAAAPGEADPNAGAQVQGSIVIDPDVGQTRPGGFNSQATKITPAKIRTEVVIPGSPVESTVEGFFRGRVGDIASYLDIIYNFLVSAVGMVAATMIMIAGFQYLTAGGDSSKVDAAKKRIGSAMLGLILVLASYVLLNTINPNLVNFQVPRIEQVKPELNFIPFCDKLMEQLKIDKSEFTKATDRGRCGDLWFYSTTITDNKGVEKTSRKWCIFRGPHYVGWTDRPKDSTADYGCDDEVGNTDTGYIHATDGGWNALSICLPYGNLRQEELDKAYDAKKALPPAANCKACHELTPGSLQYYSLPVGDEGCQIWQNVANNGDPLDPTAQISKKGIYQDTRAWTNDDRSKRMYYCGYSTDKKGCIYTPIHCDDISSCGGYEAMDAHYCYESGKAEITCNSDRLGSEWGQHTGNVRHMMPVCEGNFCEVAGGCKVPGMAGIQGAIGAGSSIRVTARVLSGGILGSVDCKGN